MIWWQLWLFQGLIKSWLNPSLLGECTLCQPLILASFVGSLCSANAWIVPSRVWPEVEQRPVISGIWSPSIFPKEMVWKDQILKGKSKPSLISFKQASPDRAWRNGCFDLHQKITIESGIRHLAFDNIHILKNSYRLRRDLRALHSSSRTPDGWQKALLENMELQTRVQVDKHFLPLAIFWCWKLARWLTARFAVMLSCFWFTIHMRWMNGFSSIRLSCSRSPCLATFHYYVVI